MDQEKAKEIEAYYKKCFDEGATAEDVEDWDSLTHITLVSAVEDEFGIKFKMKEVSAMKNVGEMVAIISERI